MAKITSIGDAIRSGTKWFLISSAGSQVLQFAIGVALARLLTPADFGMLVTIQIFTGFVGFIAGAGMGQALVQAKQVQEHHFQVIFTLQLGIGVLIYIGFFLIAPWFADWFGTPIYKDLLRVSAISFVLRPFANIPNTRLTRQMRFKAQAVNSVVSLFVTGLLSIAMAAIGMGVWALVLSGIAGSLTSILIILSVTRWRPGFAYDAEAAKRLGVYGIKVSANDIAVYLHQETANFIISRIAGPAMVGLYNKADSLSTLPLKFVSNPAYQPMLTALAKVQDNKDQSCYMYFRALTLVTVYALPLFVGLWWVAEPFVRVVYGERWAGAIEPLQILLLVGLFHCIGSQSGALVAAQNRLSQELYIQIESWILAAIACFMTVKYGIVAVAWATAAVFTYTNLRVAHLAIRSVGASVLGLLKSLRPALLLNGLLIVILATAHWSYFGAVKVPHPVIYLVGMGVVGSTAYLVMFLNLPLRDLTTEAMRWKRALRLVR
jgi:O-antigen/teichoic acid export membrane protein